MSQRRRSWKERRQSQRYRLAVARDWMLPAPGDWASFGRSVLHPPLRVTNKDCITIGDGVTIMDNVFLSVVRAFPDITPRLVIHDGVTIGRGCVFAVAGEVVVGRGATIGDFCLIADTYHPYEKRDRLPTVVRPTPVRIGEDAVLGGHTVVLPGVTIGAGAYLEHHTVVSRDVEPGAVVAAYLVEPLLAAD